MAERWLVIAHEATNSGASRMLCEVLRGVRNAYGSEWNCEILLDRGGPLMGELTKLGRVRRLTPFLANRPGLLARNFCRLLDRPRLKRRRLARCVVEWQRQGDGVIYSNTGTNGWLLRALPKNSNRVVSHIHELAYSLRRFNWPSDLATTLARTDLFLAVSAAVMADLCSLEVPPERIKYLPNFLPALPALPDKIEARAEVCRQLRLPPESRFIAGCGHIEWVKGTDLFAEMAILASERSPAAPVFIWLGGDADRQFARHARATARGRVRFTGAVDNPSLYFAASEAVVVASRVESFSLVALEAGALGRPVLAYSAARGLADLLDQDSLVTELSAMAMADAVAELLQRPKVAQQRGERLRERIEAGFLAKQWIGELLAAMEGVEHG